MSDLPQFLDSMGREVNVGDIVMIPGVPVKWIIDAVEIGSTPDQPPMVRISAHASLISMFPADQLVPQLTRAATAEERKHLDEELEASTLRRTPSIHRPS